MLYVHAPMKSKNPKFSTFTHLISDSDAELIRYAVSIGMHPRWIQKAGTPYCHFDLTGKFLNIALNDTRVKLVSRTEFMKVIDAKKSPPVHE